MDKKRAQIYLFIGALASVAAEIRIKGLSATRSTFYDPNADFTCLDGSDKIPFTYINDDYCDCKDGSDEPGTSACPNGMFFCRNIGYRSHYIPSSRVNDGICDCCDGSDEWFTEMNCTDTCYERGASAREEAKKKYELQQQGYQMKLQYSEQGKLTKKEKQEKLANLQREKLEIETLKTEREAAKNEAEAPEAAALEKFKAKDEEIKAQKRAEEKRRRDNEALAYFDSLDTNQDGILTVSEILARPSLDQNRDGQVTEDEANFFLSGQTEMTKEEFVNIGYVLMKPYLKTEQEAETTTSTETPSDTGDLPHIPEGDNEEEDEEEPEPYDHEHEDKSDEGVEGLPLEEASQYDPETQAIVDAAKTAREAYHEAERQLRDMEREIKNIEDSMRNDYGPDEEFLALHGHCFEYLDREYVYKFCPFDYASQRPASGGSETRLGQWGQWEGPEQNKYSAMKLDRGVQCWNGPQRSCKVYFSCGVDNIVTSVSEPNRCEYEMHFTTPTACSAPSGNPDDPLVHDEL